MVRPGGMPMERLESVVALRGSCPDVEVGEPRRDECGDSSSEPAQQQPHFRAALHCVVDKVGPARLNTGVGLSGAASASLVLAHVAR